MKPSFLKLTLTVIALVLLTSYSSLAFNQNKNTTSISYEIPKVRELLFIAMAVSQTGEDDPYMINKYTAYYEEVCSYFKPHINAELNYKLSSEMKKNFDVLLMDACMYSLPSNGKIVLTNNTAPFSGGRKDHFRKLIPLLENFSSQSHFEEFYSNHLAFYNSLIKTLTEKSNTESSLEWLNREFGMEVEKVGVIFSPLSYGRHSTQIQVSSIDPTRRLYVSAFPEYVKEMTDFEKEIYTSRMIFTELDHHFVNPNSQQFKKDIRKIFHQRKFWIDDDIQQSYRRPQDVFNEYMTWSLFLVYMNERLEMQEYTLVKKSIYKQMLKRGFTQFEQFNECVMQCRLQYSENNIELLMPIIIKALLTSN